jgi:hypothetical protein
MDIPLTDARRISSVYRYRTFRAIGRIARKCSLPPLPERIHRWLAVRERFRHIRRAAADLCGGMIPNDPNTIALDDAALARLAATLCTLDGYMLLQAIIGPDRKAV